MAADRVVARDDHRHDPATRSVAGADGIDAGEPWTCVQRGGEPIDLRTIEQGLLRIRAEFGRRQTDIQRVHLEMVDDARMDAYHRRFSGVAGTTDVLTFRGSEGPGEAGGITVDLIVCADEAHRRAREFGHPPEREVLLYAVHGILHCLGHDDHDPAAFERMHAEEDSILEAAGVGATFRPRQPGGGADLVSERTDA